MRINNIHKWENLTISKAREIQEKLASKVIVLGGPEKIEYVAGADLAFSKEDNTAFGAIVILSFPELKIVELKTGSMITPFPYIPGFLSFRETPLLLKLFSQLATVPDLVLIDGQGIAHPRRFGIASHLGLFLDIPTIGCAKNILVGEYEEPAKEKNSISEIYYKGEKVGMAVRTRNNVKPVFVSPGHKIDFPKSVEWVLKLCTRYRCPEPIRLAHIEVTRFKKRFAKGNSDLEIAEKGLV